MPDFGNGLLGIGNITLTGPGSGSLPIDLNFTPEALAAIAAGMLRYHQDGTAHPDQDWTGTLPQEAQTEYEAQNFLTDPALSGRIDGPGWHWFSRCCIHGYVQAWRKHGDPNATGNQGLNLSAVVGGVENLPGAHNWIYLGVMTCPHSAGDHGPHGNHISTSTPVRPLDPPIIIIGDPVDDPVGTLIGDHHHVYTAENDPFGLVWDHEHGNDPPSWSNYWPDMLIGSGGWPRGQSTPNQTYTHTHVISTIGGRPQRGGGPAAERYSPEDGSAGGYSTPEINTLQMNPQLGYEHDHDNHGIHFHYHMYTHTHYAAEVLVDPEPWRPWFDERPPWWQDGMEIWFNNPTDLPWLEGLNLEHVGEGLIFGSIPVPDPPAILAEINAIAAGYNPELIFLGGDVHGVQGFATVGADGVVSGIEITDPGATVINVTEGTADDVDGDGIVSPDILLTKPIATNEQNAAWALVPISPLPFSWFENFAATAHVSDNPTTIASHLPEFFKDEGELRAAAASSGYVDPIAQTFMVNIEDAPNGLFIESVDLCFQNKPAFGNEGDPVTVEIRPTVNGYPSSENVLSGYGGASASRTLNAAEVNVADGYPTTAVRDWEDPSLFHMNRYNGLLPGFSGLPYATSSRRIGRARGGRRGGGGGGLAAQNDAYIDDASLIPPRYTRFVFPSPIFLARNTEYAIVVRSNSDDYMCWVSDARSIAGATTTAVGATGGSVSENFGFTGVPNLASHEGPQFGGSFFKSQNGRTWTADQYKDLMFRINRTEFTTSQGTVSMSGGHWLASDFEYDRAELDAFSLMTPEGTSITQTYQTQLAADSAPRPFTTATDVSDIFLTTKSFNERMVLGSMLNSSGDGGGFKINSILSTTDPRVSPVIDKTNINVKTIRNRINGGELSNNQINIIASGTNFVDDNELDIHGGGGIGAKLKVVTGVDGQVTSAYISNPGSGYYKAAYANVGFGTVASGLDLKLLGEEGVSGGNGQARYITKSVTLASDMDAIDLKVYLTSSKPAGSSVRVYYRVCSQYDQQAIGEKKWTAMELISPDEEMTSNDVGEGIEPSPMEFEFGTVDDYITYSVGDQTFSEFKVYQIKIVLFASNPARVPILTDFRAIAVT
jgi:hypothetical protein